MQKSFDTWKDNVNRVMQERPLQIISWEATRRCNLNCLHCGSPNEAVDLSDELTTEEVIAAFMQIAKEFDLSRFHHINITGGEPFVRKDLLDILKEITKVKEFRNIAIQTNGIYISENPQVLDKLKGYGVTGIGVSIDGLESTHDAFRRKEGTWKKAIKAAKSAVEKGFVVTISVTAHSKNMDEIPLLYEHVKKFHPRYFRVMTLDPIGRARLNKEYLLSPQQTKKLISFLKAEHEKNYMHYPDPKTTILELGCGGWLSTELEGRVRPYIFHCIAGINNLGILYDGKIASCSNIPRDFIEGDLRKENIKKMWDTRFQKFKDKEWLRTGDCKNCSEWEYCHGGPMHKRLIDGTMLDCLYQTLYNDKDYRETLPEVAFVTVAGN